MSLPLPPPQRPDVSGLEAALTADHPLAAAGADVYGGRQRHGRRHHHGRRVAVAPPAHVRRRRRSLPALSRCETGRVHALNGSGRAGSRATPSASGAGMPKQGVLDGDRARSRPGAWSGRARALRHPAAAAGAGARDPPSLRARGSRCILTRLCGRLRRGEQGPGRRSGPGERLRAGGRLPEMERSCANPTWHARWRRSPPAAPMRSIAATWRSASPPSSTRKAGSSRRKNWRATAPPGRSRWRARPSAAACSRSRPIPRA